MGFAVYHTAKGKGSGGGLGNHIDRTIGKEHTYKNADKNLRGKNIEYAPKKYTEIPLEKAIKKRLEEGYNGKRKIRTDAVKYITHVFSGSNKEMTEIFNNQDKTRAKAWIDENLKFAVQEFGAKNIVRATLHLDEKTPHLHVVSVPLTSDGRLSAKEMIGNREVLEARQDRYAEAMKPFGLERGLKQKGIKHETAQQYRKRLAFVQNAKPISDEIKLSKGFLGVVTDKSIQEANNELERVNLVVKRLQEEVQKLQYHKKQLSRNSNHYEKLNRKNVETAKHYRDLNAQNVAKIKEIVLNPEQLQKFQKNVLQKRAKEQEQNIKKTRGKGRGFSR